MSTSAFITSTQAFRIGSMKRILGLVKPWSLSSISSSVAFDRRALFFRSRPRVLSFDWYEDDLVLGWEHTLGHHLAHARNTSSVTLHHIIHPHNWRQAPLRTSVVVMGTIMLDHKLLVCSSTIYARARATFSARAWSRPTLFCSGVSSSATIFLFKFRSFRPSILPPVVCSEPPGMDK